MKKHYLIVVLAHPIHGRLKRLHVPHYALHLALALTVLCGIVGVGFFSSYSRMLGKVTEFNQMRSEKAALQKQYDELRDRSEERDVQLASLGSLASEVSIAFGIKREDFGGRPGLFGNTSVATGYDASRNQFDFLQSVRLPSRGNHAMLSMLSNTTPSVWPIKGRISGSFGMRKDPFHGRGAFHGGVDLSTDRGTPVVATADGIVEEAGWSMGGYGKRVELSHGANGISTLYAHLTEVFATPGQVVRRGEVVGRAGSTGRSTGTHLHYEVRFRGVAVNPYRFLHKTRPQMASLRVAD